MALNLLSIFMLMAAFVLLGQANAQEGDMPEAGGDDMGNDFGSEDYADDYGGEDDGDEEGHPSPTGELQELTSVGDFDTFINDTDASVILAFTAESIPKPGSLKPHEWDDEEDGEWEAEMIENPSFASYKAISSSMYGYRFAYTKSLEVMEKLKSKTGGLYLYRSPFYVSKEHGDRARERFPGENLNEAAVGHWLASKAQPLVGEFSSTTRSRYQSAVLIIFMNLDFEMSSKSVNYVLKRARKVAVGLKGKLAIAVASITSMSYKLSDYGLTSTKDSDILLAIQAGPDDSALKYGAPADKAFSGDTLSAFANAYLAGELTPYQSPEADKETPSDDADYKAKDEM